MAKGSNKDPKSDEFDVNAGDSITQLKDEKKQFKAEQKAQKQEAKKKKKELAKKAADLDDDDGGGGLSVVLITILIIFMWLIIMAILIKLDVGGFGSSVMKPLLKDVPYLNLILPEDNEVIDTAGNSASGAQGSSSIQTVDSAYVKKLEQELANEQQQNSTYSASIERLQTEVDRLQPFEEEQDKLEKERQQFYKDIVFGDNTPGADAYASYYAMIEPDAAASIYKGVVESQTTDEEVKKYAAAYSAMKPKEAAAIFNAMDDLSLAARILNQMSSDDRGAILGKMDAAVADKVTKLMEPEGLPELPGNSAATGKE